jgi:glucose-6-phosphate isomerase
LLATWEHRVFITASMLEINPFDQYGVTAGKDIAKKFLS